MTTQKLLNTILKDTPAWFRISLSIALTVAILVTPVLLDETSTETKPQGEIQGIQSDSSYLVTKVVDGDTIKIAIDNEIKTVRIANMNTPESVHPTKEVECFGVESSKRMEELALNKQVTLQTDPTQQNTDRYGRLLRFVFLKHEDTQIDLGLQLISEGFAYSSPYGTTPHPYLEQYEQAQKDAQENNVGLWSQETCQ